MNFFRLNIYTNFQKGLRHIIGGEMGGETSAIPVKEKGKVISPGYVKERLNFLDMSDAHYRLAIEVLTPEEQDNVRKRGHAGWAWLKCFFWKPLTLSNDEGQSTIVLVNINSAIKRLKLLGFTADEVKDKLDKGTLIQECRQKFQDKRRKEVRDQVEAALKSSSIPENLHQDGAEILSHWMQRWPVKEEGIKQFVALSQEIEIREPQDFAKLLEYDLFKQTTAKSFQEETEQKEFLPLFNEIHKIKQEEERSYEDIIEEAKKAINNICVVRGDSFSQAVQRYQKRFR